VNSWEDESMPKLISRRDQIMTEVGADSKRRRPQQHDLEYEEGKKKKRRIKRMSEARESDSVGA
ncbi:hypothetical protein HK101_005279, partial [Irineochytrium annulatum]